MNPTPPHPDEDGYDLWLRYPLIDDADRLAEYRAAIMQVFFPATTPTLITARDELLRGLRGLLGIDSARRITPLRRGRSPSGQRSICRRPSPQPQAVGSRRLARKAT